MQKIGDKIGELELIEIIGKSPTKQWVGRFKCSCGKIVKRDIQNLFRGDPSNKRKNPVSCGCKTKPGRGAIKKPGFDNAMANAFLMGKM